MNARFHSTRIRTTVAVVVVLIILTFFLSPLSPFSNPLSSLLSGFGQSSDTDSTDSTIQLPESVRVPEPNEKLTDTSIAIPATTRDSNPGSRDKIRSFSLEGKDGGFSVEKIIVYQGDIVRIDMSANDQDYDISFPDLLLRQSLKQGETKRLEFQAQVPGSFVFVCDSCTQQKSKFLTTAQSKGVLIVVPKP